MKKVPRKSRDACGFQLSDLKERNKANIETEAMLKKKHIRNCGKIAFIDNSMKYHENDE